MWNCCPIFYLYFYFINKSAAQCSFISRTVDYAVLSRRKLTFTIVVKHSLKVDLLVNGWPIDTCASDFIILFLLFSGIAEAFELRQVV